ncbi:hypothetical protein DSO57_1017254 [Entomophthora muscae]|uniref:Uncharacterized protein n=1 Tax=Entomophthora muscae TaxID=34485 RepID=A0ACC2TF98_9FUNG|nr:hypothetical protein DSO57_1017254 [Entomophthora muscae]
MANCEIEALRAQEEKSVEIAACWRDDNKVLSKKIASVEAKLLKALSQEGNSNKGQGQDNGRMDWLGLDLSHCLSHAYFLQQPLVFPPEPFVLLAILAPFKNAFDATLSCALPPHYCHNLTF